MTFSMLVALLAGILVEILLLWEKSTHDQAGGQAGIVPRRSSPIQLWIGLVTLVAFLLVAVSEALALQLPAVWLGAISDAILFLSFSFLFVYGLVIPRLMPRVNEQAILAVNLITLLNLLTVPDLHPIILAGFAIPGLVLLFLGFTRHNLPPLLKSLVYFWYLLCLLALTLQNNFSVFLANDLQPANPFQYAIAGAAGIFLLLHALFLARFFLMLSALILPCNRHYIYQVMPRLFSDEQMPLGKFLLVLAFAGLAFGVNAYFGFAELPAANLLILFVVHFMDRLPNFRADRV